MKTPKHFRLAIVLIVGFCLSTAHAAPIVTPTGLNNGDTYRLVFVTSTTTNAVSTDISTYNSFVTSVANTQTELAALNTNWTAIVSTDAVDARDNTNTNPFSDGTGAPIYLLDGMTLIANNNADLWDGSIGYTISLDEAANGISAGILGDNVWSGTAADGTGASLGRVMGSSVSNPFPGASVGVASTTFINSLWIERAVGDKTTQKHLFAISDVLTVGGAAAVPLPAPLALFLGALGLMAFRRRSGRC